MTKGWPGFSYKQVAGFIEKGFRFLVRYNSYSTAVATYSAAVGGGLTTAFILYVWPYISRHFSTEYLFVLKLMLALPWIKAFILYGAFEKIGIPGTLKIARFLNRMITAEEEVFITSGKPSGEYKKLLYALSRMPRMLFFNALSDILIIAGFLCAYAAFTGMHYEIFIWTGFMAVVAIATYAGVTFSLAEAATGPMRQQCLQILHENNVHHVLSSRSTIRIKQFLALGLLIAVILMTNALTYLNQENLLPVIILSSITIVATLLMSRGIFAMIFDAIGSVNRAVEDLKEGKQGVIFTKSLDREFLELANGINNASQTIHEYRTNLEWMVEKRTQELEKTNSELRQVMARLEQRDLEMGQELEMAAEIQRGIIQENLTSWNGVNFAATYLPMGKVSGDYYDIFRHSHCVYILLSDVSGHGVPAALVTMAAKEAFSRFSSDSRLSPAQIFSTVNNMLHHRIKTQDYLTAFMLKVDENNLVTYCNAAHQHAVHLSHATGEYRLLDTEGLFIGSMREAESSYRDGFLKLEAGDRIFLYTDGLIDNADAAGEVFGLDRFLAIIREATDLPLEAVHNRIIVAFNQFIGKAPVKDDITLLSVELDSRWDAFQKLFHEGISHHEKKEFFEAQYAFSRAHDLIATYPPLLTRYAESCFHTGDTNRALQLIQTFVEKYSYSPEDLVSAVEFAIQAERKDLASEWLRLLREFSLEGKKTIVEFIRKTDKVLES